MRLFTACRLTRARATRPPQPNSGPAAAASRTSVVTSRTVREASASSQAELDKLLDTLAASTAALPAFDAAAGAPALRARLLDFQAIGVAWMLRREIDPDGAVSAGGLPPFWSRVTEAGATAYLNAITKSSQDVPPEHVAGGLLADEMGLGKSVQVITLILANVRGSCARARRSARLASHASIQASHSASGC